MNRYEVKIRIFFDQQGRFQLFFQSNLDGTSAKDLVRLQKLELFNLLCKATDV